LDIRVHIIAVPHVYNISVAEVVDSEDLVAFFCYVVFGQGEAVKDGREYRTLNKGF